MSTVSIVSIVSSSPVFMNWESIGSLPALSDISAEQNEPQTHAADTPKPERRIRDLDFILTEDRNNRLNAAYARYQDGGDVNELMRELIRYGRQKFRAARKELTSRDGIDPEDHAQDFCIRVWKKLDKEPERAPKRAAEFTVWVNGFIWRMKEHEIPREIEEAKKFVPLFCQGLEDPEDEYENPLTLSNRLNGQRFEIPEGFLTDDEEMVLHYQSSGGLALEEIAGRMRRSIQWAKQISASITRKRKQAEEKRLQSVVSLCVR